MPLTKKPVFYLALGAAIVAALLLVYLAKHDRHASGRDGAGSGQGGSCTDRLDREVLDQSLALGTRFLIKNQKEDGNFNYELDWRTRTLNEDDNQVRQAGAAWGLGLIYQDSRATHDRERAAEIAPALLKALRFFDRNSRQMPGGERYVVYPGDNEGSLGTVSLVALAYIELLRGERDGGDAGILDENEEREHNERLDQYLAFLMHVRGEDGRFRNGYSFEDGSVRGSPSPYSEGETLLAFVKAAKYLGRDALREPLLASADACYEANVTRAREENADSDTTKGFYQWSSMTFYEIATTDWPNVSKYGDWLLELASWMIDTHHILTRTRNTGYAFEGLIHAYAYATRTHEEEQAQKLRCAVEEGLEKLTSWQVGGPIANEYIREGNASDDRAIGGVQNHAREPGLRIDVAQHQMHAVILARRYVFTTGA